MRLDIIEERHQQNRSERCGEACGSHVVAEIAEHNLPLLDEVPPIATPSVFEPVKPGRREDVRRLVVLMLGRNVLQVPERWVGRGAVAVGFDEDVMDDGQNGVGELGFGDELVYGGHDVSDDFVGHAVEDEPVLYVVFECECWPHVDEAVPSRLRLLDWPGGGCGNGLETVMCSWVWYTVVLAMNLTRKSQDESAMISTSLYTPPNTATGFTAATIISENPQVMPAFTFWENTTDVYDHESGR